MQLNKNNTKLINLINVKITIGAILLCGAIITLWIRTFFIQVIWRDDFVKKSKVQYWKRELVHGSRGDIYTKDNVLLANSVILKSVFVVPTDVENPEVVSKKLSKILNINKRKIYKEIVEKKKFVWIKRKISDKQAKEIKQANLQGVYLTDEMARVYPQKTMAGQLIGFVGIDNRGLEGLEKGLDNILSGKKEYHLVQRDGKGRVLYAPGELENSRSGKDIFLTIDSRIQWITEDILAKGVFQAKGGYGIAIVVYVPTGEILAWAQYPFFNPNKFYSSSPKIWRNRIALDLIEPGSTIKPLVVAAALTKKTTNLKKIYYCENGKWKFEGVEIKDTHAYNWLTIPRIIRYSSNICSAKIGLELGGENLFEFFKKIGFGQTTSLPLPGEAKGIIKRDMFFNKVDLANISFGQGISLTPLQLVRAYLCVSNFGKLQKLKIVQDVDNDEDVSLQVIPQNVSKAILSIMKGVVEKDGTGSMARIPGFEVGGKTGTSQKVENGKYSKEKYQACFVGVIPALEPKYLCFVLIDEPKTNIYGGVVAAPVVRDIFKRIIPLDESIRPIAQERLDDVKRDATNEKNIANSNKYKKIANLSTVPNLTGLSLREVLIICSKIKIVPKIKGSGPVVIRQAPSPGKKIKNSITVWLGYPKLN